MDNKYSGVKERVLQIAECKNIPKEKFFSDIGMTYGNFKGRSKYTPLNSNAIAAIFTKFPDINLEWLLTGKGSMLKESMEAAPGQVGAASEHDRQLMMMLKEKVRILEDSVEILKESKSLQARIISYLEDELSRLGAADRVRRGVTEPEFSTSIDRRSIK